jgi:hypothetical protein
MSSNIVDAFSFYGSDFLKSSNSKLRNERFKHLAGVLRRRAGLSQGLYLNITTQHRRRRTHIHAYSRIRTLRPQRSNSPRLYRSNDWQQKKIKTDANVKGRTVYINWRLYSIFLGKRARINAKGSCSNSRNCNLNS